jgi:hypothetical protein
MINKIFGFFKGGNNDSHNYKDSLDKIKLQGSFHKKVIGGSKETIGDECTIYLSIVNDKTFDYNLNVYNDEYQFSSKNENFNNFKNIFHSKYLDTWETISFALTNDRGFKLCYENGREVLVWEYNRDFYLFYFFHDDENSKNKPEFFTHLVNLIASYEYAEDYEKASKLEGNSDYLTSLGEVEEICEFLDQNYSGIYGEAKEKSPEKKKSPESTEKISLESDLISKFDKISITQLNFRESYPNATRLFESKGMLHKYDKVKDDLVVVSDNANLGLYSAEAFKYYLVVEEAQPSTGIPKTYTMTSVSQDINLITNMNENLIMWLSQDDIGSNEKTAYNFVFYTDDVVDLFRKVIAKGRYESSSLSKYEDLKEDERDWIENENMPDTEFDEDAVNDVDMEMENEYQESATEKLNKVTAQAYLHDRTFVVRDDNTIGVYKTDEEDILTHLANLPAVVQYEDKNLDIRNAQMFYSDTNMILLDQNNPNSAFRFDLGKGKIVEEWSAEEMKTIDQVVHERKFDQMTDNQVMHGVNKNNLFTMDARVNKKNKVVATKSYKTNPKMSCLTSTDFGGVATGSLNGEIRLYSGVGKNAKTLLPCFGDAIKSIDTTADGKYLLATCDKYLILVPTAMKGDKNGFNTQMGKEKPHPRTLKIKPIDMTKYHLEDLQFTPARFNVNKIDGEANIITSMGDYVVIWNFAKVKKGILDDYKIKRVNQHVIENQFKFNRNQIVVTMDHKLRIQNQKMMFHDK